MSGYGFGTPMVAIEGLDGDDVLKLAKCGICEIAEAAEIERLGGLVQVMWDHGVRESAQMALLDALKAARLVEADPMNAPPSDYFEAWPETYQAPVIFDKLGVATMREIYCLLYSPPTQSLPILPEGERRFFEEFFETTGNSWVRPTTRALQCIGNRLAYKWGGFEEPTKQVQAEAEAAPAGPVVPAAELESLREDHEFAEAVREMNAEIKRLRSERDKRAEAYKEAKKRHQGAQEELNDFIADYRTGQKRLPFPDGQQSKQANEGEKKGKTKAPKVQEIASEPTDASWRILPSSAISADPLMRKLEKEGIKTAGDAYDWAVGVGDAGKVVIKAKIPAQTEMRRIIREWVDAQAKA